MKCSDVLDRLSAYYDGELSGTAGDSIAQHLTACERCASEYAGFESLSRIVQESPLPTVPPEIWAGIGATFSDNASTESKVSLTKPAIRPRSRVSVRQLALAVSVLLLLGYGVWLSQHLGNPHHEHNAEFVATMDHYLKTLDGDPEGAEQLLLDKYNGQTVDPGGAVQLVGYRPAVAQGLPEGYSLASTSVLKMPCCTCVKAVCKRQDGSTLVLFEHDDEKTDWFGQRPTNMAMCGDTECCLVDLDSSIAATWQRGSRSMTAVGVRDKAEVSKLASWLDNKTEEG
ncbi:MAG: zf-HC2 domain-containing protein [Pirellulaceae bacterium]